MGKTEKDEKIITQLKWPKYQKPKDENMGWRKHQWYQIKAKHCSDLISFDIIEWQIIWGKDLVYRSRDKIASLKQILKQQQHFITWGKWDSSPRRAHCLPQNWDCE